MAHNLKGISLFNIVLIVIGAMLLFQPATDPDFGWQYKYGEYIVTNHAILKDNIFSYTYTNYFWANSYWLAQIVFYVLFSKIGQALSIALISLGFSGALVYAIAKLPNKNTIAKVTTFLITMLPILSYQLVVRPMYFSSIFLLILIYALLYKPKLVRYSPLLFLVWANIHADFTMGLLIIAVYKFSEVLVLFKNKTLTFKFFTSSSINYALCLLATLINPYGISLWTTLLKDTSHFFKFLSINEMLPVNIFTASAGQVVMLLLFPGIILSVAILIPTVNKILKRTNEFNLWYSVLLLIFFIWSIRSIYFVRILFLLGVPGLYYLINLYSTELAKKLAPSAQTKKQFKLIGLMAIVMIFLVSCEAFLKNLTFTIDSKALCKESKLPCDAIAKIKEVKPDGNMFNDYSWGGYLIMQLPEYKTFIDGRMASWKYDGNYLFEDYLKMFKDYKTNSLLFENYVDKYNIKWAILKSDAKMASQLLETKQWEVLYKDDIAVVLTKI